MLLPVMSACGTAAGWCIALWAANRRGIKLGGIPTLCLVLIAATAWLVGVIAGPSLAATTVAIGVAAVVDARCGYVFNPLVIAGLIAVLASAAAEQRLTSASVGAISAVCVLFVIRLVAGVRGLGIGDVKLAAVLGSGLGPIHGLTAIGWAFVLGAGVAVCLLAAGRLQRGAQVPFGPYLLAGSLCDLAYHRLTTGVFS